MLFFKEGFDWIVRIDKLPEQIIIPTKLLIDEFCECLVVIILFGSIGKWEIVMLLWNFEPKYPWGAVILILEQILKCTTHLPTAAFIS